MAIFSILILLICEHEHERSFHLLRSSSISFFRDLKFLSYRSFTCLVRVTPRYFTLFVTIVKGVVSLTSLSAHLFFVYKKGTDLLELILYPATLLKLFIMCKEFFGRISGSLMYTIISSANCDTLISSFPICISLTSFCCLIALARTLSTILNK
ncbi:mCG146853 [Mus musculus]|nr:mCG146853 [Mus musculus]